MNRFVLSVSRCLIPAFATACWATASLAQGGPPTVGVNVLNTPLAVTGSVTTSGSVTLAPGSSVSITNPADLAKAMGIQHPWQVGTFCKWNGGNGCTVFDKIRAPANQRIIIEYVSGGCLLDTGLQVADVNIQTTVGTAIVTHEVPVINPAGVVRGGQDISFGQMVRIYVDQNKNIDLEVTSTNVSSSAACFLALSGQAIDVP